MVGLGIFGHWPLHLGSLHVYVIYAVGVAACSWCPLRMPDARWVPVYISEGSVRALEVLCACRMAQCALVGVLMASGAPTAAKISLFFADFSLNLISNHLKTLYNSIKSFIMICVTSNTFWPKFLF